MLAVAVLLTHLMCRVHGSSSFHVSNLHTQAAVVMLAGLQLGSQSLAVLLQLTDLRLQLCQLTCMSGTQIGPNCLSLSCLVHELPGRLTNWGLVKQFLRPSEDVLTGSTTQN